MPNILCYNEYKIAVVNSRVNTVRVFLRLGNTIIKAFENNSVLNTTPFLSNGEVEK